MLVVLVSALLIRSVYTLGLDQRRHRLQQLERYGVQRRRLRRYLLLELSILAVLGRCPVTDWGCCWPRSWVPGLVPPWPTFRYRTVGNPHSVTGFLVTVAVMALVVFWCGLDLFKGGRGQTGMVRFQVPLALGALIAGAVTVLVAGSWCQRFWPRHCCCSGRAWLLPGCCNDWQLRTVTWHPCASGVAVN